MPPHYLFTWNSHLIDCLVFVWQDLYLSCPWGIPTSAQVWERTLQSRGAWARTAWRELLSKDSCQTKGIAPSRRKFQGPSFALGMEVQDRNPSAKRNPRTRKGEAGGWGVPGHLWLQVLEAKRGYVRLCLQIVPRVADGDGKGTCLCARGPEFHRWKERSKSPGLPFDLYNHRQW